MDTGIHWSTTNRGKPMVIDEEENDEYQISISCETWKKRTSNVLSMNHLVYEKSIL